VTGLLPFNKKQPQCAGKLEYRRYILMANFMKDVIPEELRATASGFK
jgi:hypothetical protein